MEKEFDIWNDKKKYLDNFGKGKFFHSREIWWCSIGLNVGSEENGKDRDFKRPVLIIKGFSERTCLVAPITSSKGEHPHRLSIGFATGKESKVILSQIKVIDTKRLLRKISVLDRQTFEIIRKSVRACL